MDTISAVACRESCSSFFIGFVEEKQYGQVPATAIAWINWKRKGVNMVKE